MNKAAVAVALVAVACVALVEANKLPAHRRPHLKQEHQENEAFEYEPSHLEHRKHRLPHAHRHHGHHHFDDEHDQEHEHEHEHEGHSEHDNEQEQEQEHGQHGQHGHRDQHELPAHRGQHGHHGHHEHEHELGHHEHEHEHGRHTGNHQHHNHVPKFTHHGKGSTKRKGQHGAAGLGGGVIGGAGAAFRDHEGHRASLENRNRIADRKRLEAKKGFVVGEKKGIDADVHRSQEDDTSAIRKHQVINRNKVFLKDQTNAVNDVDGFRNHHGDNESAHIGAHKSKIAGAGASAKFAHDREFDNDFKAGASGERNREAAGIIGGAAAGGAGEIF